MLLRPLMARLRCQSLKTSIYLDDICLMAPTRERALEHGQILKDALESLELFTAITGVLL